MVMLNKQYFPVRALYGGLPGPLQTVGRAERYALLQAVRASQDVQLVVSGLLGLVREAEGWDDELASARGKHAAIWRDILQTVEQQGRHPPKLRRVPAHLTFQQMVDKNISMGDWIGNQWADAFAKWGASQIEVPSSVVAATKAKMQEAVVSAKYVAWASMRIASAQYWEQRDGYGKKIVLPKPIKHDHTRGVTFYRAYVRTSARWLCAVCELWTLGAVTTCKAAVRQPGVLREEGSL